MTLHWPGSLAGDTASWPGLAFIIRPEPVGLCLIPARLPGRKRSLVLFAGLKGAVPTYWASS